MITILVVQTDCYTHSYWDVLKEGPSSVPDITEFDMLVFLTISGQIEYTLSDQLQHHWATAGQFYMAFCGYMIKWGRYWHILQFLQFTDSWNEIDRMEGSFDRLWKIHKLLEILYSIFSKVYSTSKDQAAEKFVFLFKGKAVFKQCIAKKYKCFGMKTHKLCNFAGYTYNIKVYLRKDRQCPAQQLTAAHATVI